MRQTPEHGSEGVVDIAAYTKEVAILPVLALVWLGASNMISSSNDGHGGGVKAYKTYKNRGGDMSNGVDLIHVIHIHLGSLKNTQVYTIIR